MKRYSTEFEEMMKVFELTLKKSTIRGRLDREPRGSTHYYQDGAVNAWFEMFMSGYQFAKCLARAESLPLDE